MPTEPSYIAITTDAELVRRKTIRFWCQRHVQAAHLQNLWHHRVSHRAEPCTVVFEAWPSDPGYEGEPRFDAEPSWIG